MGKDVWFWLDMDGTIADLYGVEGWLDSLQKEHTKPYRIARAIYKGRAMIPLLKKAKEAGFKLGIVSWTAKNGTKEYNEKIAAAKKKWLIKHGFFALMDAVEVVPYGRSKTKVCEKHGAGVLFDDEKKNLENWTLGKTIDASANNLLTVIEALIPLPKSELLFTDVTARKTAQDALSAKRFLVLDTETANGHFDETTQKVDLSQSLVYDLGYAIIDNAGNVLQQRSFIIADIFLDENLMNSAYYKEKIPRYWKNKKAGKRKLVTFQTAYAIFQQDVKDYNIEFYSAHNAPFDINALNNTLRVLTASKKRYFFKYGTAMLDTLQLAQSTICKRQDYVAFCWEHGYLTNHKTPRPRATAEILHRYLTNNTSFVESHTGLEDVLIEKDILIECLKELKARY